MSTDRTAILDDIRASERREDLAQTAFLEGSERDREIRAERAIRHRLAERLRRA